MDILSLTRNSSMAMENSSRTPQPVSSKVGPKPAAEPPEGVPPDIPAKNIFAKKEADRIGQKTPETMLDRLEAIQQTGNTDAEDAVPIEDGIKLALMGIQLPPRPAELVKAMGDLGIDLPKFEGSVSGIQEKLVQAVSSSNLPQPVKDVLTEAIQLAPRMPAPASNMIDMGRVPMPTPGPKPLPRQEVPQPIADPKASTGAGNLPDQTVNLAVQPVMSATEQLDPEMMNFLNLSQTAAPNQLGNNPILGDLPDPTLMPEYLNNLDITVTKQASGEVSMVADAANPVKVPTPDPLGKPQTENREVPNPTIEPNPSAKSAPKPGATGDIGLTSNRHEVSTINVTKETIKSQDQSLGAGIKGQELVAVTGNAVPKPKPLGKPVQASDVPGKQSDGSLNLVAAKDQIKKTNDVTIDPKDLGRPTTTPIVKGLKATGSGDLVSALTNTDKEEILPAPAPDPGPENGPAPIAGRPVQASQPVAASTKTLPKESVAKVIDQVADRIENMVFARKSGTVSMKLNPQDLGTITLTVKSIGTKVDTEIKASQDEVRVALEANRQTLVQNVESRGLTLNSFNVGQDQTQGNNSQNHQMAQAEADRNAVLRQAASQPEPTRPTPRPYVSTNAAVDYFI